MILFIVGLQMVTHTGRTGPKLFFADEPGNPDGSNIVGRGNSGVE